MTSQMIAAPGMSEAVTGNRLRIVVSTGSWFLNKYPRLGGQLRIPE
jgi:hypothetical protein